MLLRLLRIRNADTSFTLNPARQRRSLSLVVPKPGVYLDS
jgi:hypothetical protein